MRISDWSSDVCSSDLAWLKESEGRLARFVRLNPLNSGLVDADLDAVIGAGADALVLSKAEGAASVQALAAKLQGFQIPILPIATETPAAIFQRSEERRVGKECGSKFQYGWLP